MIVIELTENEAKVIANELWLRMHSRRHNALLVPTGPYLMWLQSAYAKIHESLPQPAESADNH